MILFIQIRYFRESNLVSRILILELIQVVFTPPYDIVGIIGPISWVSSHSVIAHTHKVRRLVGSISLVLGHVVPSLL